MSAELEGFATIPRSIQRDPDVTWQEKVVYLALSSRANARLQCWPSHAVIAADASVSVTTAKKALNDLRTRGVLFWEPYPSDVPGQKVNLYTLGGDPRSVAATPSRVATTPPASHDQPQVATDLLTIEGNDEKEVDAAPDPVLEAFEEFWEAYPRSRRAGSKAKNLAKFRTVVRSSGVNPQVIVAAIKARVAWWEQEQTPDAFRKTSIPWLNGGCWEEEIVGLRAKVPVEEAYGFTENRPHREPTWLDDDILGGQR